MREEVPPASRADPAGTRLRHRILQAGAWGAAGFALDKLIAAGQLVILARLLTPNDFGVMAASAVVLLTVLTLSEVGLEPSLVIRRQVSEADLNVAWTLSIGRALVLAIGIWIFAGSIAIFFRAPELEMLLRVHALAVLVQGAQSPALAILLRNFDHGKRVRLDLSRRVIEATATISLAYWLQNVWALLGGQLAGFVVGCVLSYKVSPFKPRLSLDREALNHFLQYAKHVNLTTTLIFGVMSGGEFVIGRMLGTEALGVYQIALAIPLLIGVRASFMMSQVSFPAYAALQQDRIGIVRAFGLQVGGVALMLLPLAVGLAFIASDAVRFLFGPRWLEAAEPFRLLCFFAIFAGFSGVMASLHYGLNRPDFQTRIWAVQFAVFAATIMPLVTWFGLEGAAGAITLSYAVGCLLHFFYTVRILGLEAWSCFSVVGRIVPVVGALGLFLIILRHVPSESGSSWHVMLGVAAAIAAYFGYLWRVEYPKLAHLWRGTN